MFLRQDLQSLSWRMARVNWLVPVLVIVLAGIGALTLTSAAGGSPMPWALRHALRCGGGLAAMLACAMVPLRVWRALALPVYAAALALLVAVPMIGTEVLGAKRWIAYGGVSLQPSEIMKVALVLMVAWLFSAAPSRLRTSPIVAAPLLILVALPLALTLKQPDLGTAVMLAGIGIGLMFLGGTPWWLFAGGGAGLLAALPAAAARLQEYQLRRIETFLDPAADPLGSGYHITQARIALGNGGLSGQGFLHGSQSQLDFVPEKMTDFIFVVIGEEWGFAGALAVLAVYAILIGVLLAMALGARDVFGRLVIAGVAVTLALYVSINIAMVTGLVPVVGVPLPLISYGGTSLMTLMAALGMALSAGIERNNPESTLDLLAFSH